MKVNASPQHLMELFKRRLHLEDPCGANNHGEESREERSQYFHEHGDVIENICKKSGGKSNKSN